jgi:hypothetical protein
MGGISFLNGGNFQCRRARFETLGDQSARDAMLMMSQIPEMSD